jgi:protein-disulfide isomerase
LCGYFFGVAMAEAWRESRKILKMYFRLAAWCIGVVMPLAVVAQMPAGPVAPPAAAAAPANPFPATNPKFFTAASPTVETVNAFLTQLWGFDPNRIWSVAAILSTNAPGVSKVVVYVADKTQPGKSQTTTFFTTPDGRHAIADNVIEFGPTPFADTRKVLQARADGPARGAVARELLLVEFSDFQCPHCKDAQAIMDQLVTDFPQARVVFQNYPLVDIHPQAFQAAAVGLCVKKAKGDEAFFKYAQAVFDAQAALTEQDAAATLDTAVTKAGGDPAAMVACSKTQPIVDALNASVQTAKTIGVDSTPTLFVNGQPIPIGSIPYEVLKKIVAYRANQDGVPVTVQPSLKTLK